MFGDKLKSIEMCISRFDEETRNSILDLYTKVDEGVNLNGEEETVEETSETLLTKQTTNSKIVDMSEINYKYNEKGLPRGVLFLCRQNI